MEDFAKTPEGIELAELCLTFGYKLAGNVQDLTRDQINFLMLVLREKNRGAEAAALAERGITKIYFGND